VLGNVSSQERGGGGAKSLPNRGSFMDRTGGAAEPPPEAEGNLQEVRRRRATLQEADGRSNKRKEELPEADGRSNKRKEELPEADGRSNKRKEELPEGRETGNGGDRPLGTHAQDETPSPSLLHGAPTRQAGSEEGESELQRNRERGGAPETRQNSPEEEGRSKNPRGGAAKQPGRGGVRCQTT
jgi:hypothetical protein